MMRLPLNFEDAMFGKLPEARLMPSNYQFWLWIVRNTTALLVGVIAAMTLVCSASAQESFALADAGFLPPPLDNAGDLAIFPTQISDIEHIVSAEVTSISEGFSFEGRAETGFVNPMRAESRASAPFEKRVFAVSEHRTTVKIVDPNNVVGPNEPVTVITQLSIQGLLGAAVADVPVVERATAGLNVTVDFSQPGDSPPPDRVMNAWALVNAHSTVGTTLTFSPPFDDSDFELVLNPSVATPYELIEMGDLYRVNFSRLFPSFLANVGDTVFYGVFMNAFADLAGDSAFEADAIADFFLSGLNDFRAFDAEGNPLDLQFVIGNNTPFPDPEQFRDGEPTPAPVPGALPLFAAGLLIFSLALSRPIR